jgi:hypothetical protein
MAGVMDRVYLTDRHGVTWAIFEESLDGDTPDAARGNGSSWLSFETDLEVRRLWNYPDDWRRLSDWQLDALRRRASTVVARFPRGERRAAASAKDAPDSTAR